MYSRLSRAIFTLQVPLEIACSSCQHLSSCSFYAIPCLPDFSACHTFPAHGVFTLAGVRRCALPVCDSFHFVSFVAQAQTLARPLSHAAPCCFLLASLRLADSATTADPDRFFSDFGSLNADEDVDNIYENVEPDPDPGPAEPEPDPIAIDDDDPAFYEVEGPWRHIDQQYATELLVEDEPARTTFFVEGLHRPVRIHFRFCWPSGQELVLSTRVASADFLAAPGVTGGHDAVLDSDEVSDNSR